MYRRRQNPKLDRISALPDSVLHLILSFLPTKQAVATSVLSKRWRPLWLSLTTLDFDDESFATLPRFRHFIYSLFLSQDITLPLHSFRLKCAHSFPFDPYDINRFVYAAIQRGLNHLHLDMNGAFKFRLRINLPPCVLGCKTLTVLTLKEIIVNDLPYVDFPSLKTLHLDQVTFRSHEYHIKLLSGCPVLEDLRTRGLVGIGGHHSLIELIDLPNLLRADISDMDIPFTLLHNAQFLRAELKYAYFSDIPYFNNLTHMELIFEFTKWHCDWLVEALHHCPKLQNLTIHKVSRNEIWDDVWEDPQLVPECLTSQIRTCCLRDYEGKKYELQFAKYIMQKSKALRTMTIQSAFPLGINEKLQMLMNLSLCPRVSATCKLIFE